jgi:hypothetical protein
VQVVAIDESEAKRWYCHAHESKPGNGKALDPGDRGLSLDVKCIDERRARAILLQKQIGAVRAKVAANLPLTKEDEAIYQNHHDLIIGV